MKTILAVAATVAVVMLAHVDRISVAPLLAQDRVAAVLTQVRTTLGGEQKLAAVKSMSAEGSFRRAMGSRSVEGNIALLLIRPDKLRRSEESKMFGSSSEHISTFDGAQAWDETVNAARVGGGGGGVTTTTAPAVSRARSPARTTTMRTGSRDAARPSPPDQAVC